MAEEKSTLPGVTFYVEAWNESSLGGKSFIDIRIRAEVSDWDLANRVKKKFDGGMRIHAVSDFKEKMIQVLQKDNEESEGRVVELQAESDAKTREISALKERLAQYEASFSFLGGMR